MKNLAYRPLPGARLDMAHPMAKNLVLCMLFNEQGSRAMDLSPYQANGALVGFGSPARRPFNGLPFTKATPSYIEIPARYTQLDFISEDFSIIIRVLFKDLAAHQWLFTRGLYRVDGYYFYILNTGYVLFETNQHLANQSSFTLIGSVVANQWYTLGVSRKGASVRVFRDGEDKTQTAASHINPTTCGGTAKIGISDTLAYPLSGEVEFLYVFGNRALSAPEHKAIHENPYAPYGSPMFI